MSPEGQGKLNALLVKHEAFRLKPYTDSVGKLTIGVGYNLTDRGLPMEIVRQLFAKDTQDAMGYAAHYTWWSDLNDPRQAAIVDMIYNMGATKFAGFHDTIDALSRADYARASREMLDSQWAKQVGTRAVELADMISTGEWSPSS